MNRALRPLRPLTVLLTLSLSGCSSPSTSDGAAGGGGNAPPIGLTITPPRGIYDAPLDVTLSHPSASSVRYTLDGSDPRSSASALSGTLPLKLHIDPADTTHRYLAPGYVVRASADGPSAAPGSVITHTYLFVHRVVELSPDARAPGTGWPMPGSGGQRQAMDYGMDRDVTSAPVYASLIDGALTALPSLSLVTALPNLFDPSSGIYANAEQDGIEWERFASIELLNPDRSPGFQSNAGVRIRGGFSRQASNPKHSFRLIFRGDYGNGKLRFPLFSTEGAPAFDKVDLRTAQNYSWSADGGNYDHMTMTRDVFSRDLQRQLGRPYTRSRFYHLYLDGSYWGIYQTQERSEANFAETYFGGQSEDYDVIKVDRDAGDSITATDGTLDAWQSVYTLCQAGFASNDGYYRLEGKNAQGARDAALPVLVDVDNLIDYLLVIFYTANFDAPVSKWFDNQRPNNFYAIRSRVDTTRGFVFLAHDSEHSLLADAVTLTSGVNENRVNIATAAATDGSGRASERYRMNVSDFRYFQPQWLHQKLSENALYRARFAARARALLADGGPLSAGPATALFQARNREIELAIVAESARWGDAQRPNQPRTKNDDWLPAVARVTDGFLAKRTPIVIQQLAQAGLY